MWCNQIFSLISNNKIQNTIVCDNYELANQIARMTYGDESFAIDTTLYPVQINDDYIDGYFYRDNKIINRNLTEKEEIEELKRQLLDIKSVTYELYKSVENNINEEAKSKILKVINLE